MSNVLSVNREYFDPQAYLINDSDLKIRQEAETKERTLPFDVVKFALANLPQYGSFSISELDKRVTRILIGVSADNSFNEDLEAIYTLKNSNNSELQESIEKLVDLYRQINSKINKMDPERKNLYIANLAKKLFAAGDREKADELISTMEQCDNYKGECLCDFAKFMFKIGNYQKAVEYAKQITANDTRDNLIFEVVTELTKNMQVKDAIPFFEMLTDYEKKINLFTKLSKCFKNNIDLEVIIDLIGKIPYEERDSYTFIVISEMFDRNAIGIIVLIINTLVFDYSKVVACCNLFVSLRISGDLSVANLFFKKACDSYKKALLCFDDDLIRIKNLCYVKIRNERLKALADSLFFSILKSKFDKNDVHYKTENIQELLAENLETLFDKVMGIVNLMTPDFKIKYIKEKLPFLLNLNLINEAKRLTDVLRSRIECFGNNSIVGELSYNFFGSECDYEIDFIIYEKIDRIVCVDCQKAFDIVSSITTDVVKGLALLKISIHLDEVNRPDDSSVVFNQAYEAFRIVYGNIPFLLSEVEQIENQADRDQYYELFVLNLMFDHNEDNALQIEEIIELIKDENLRISLIQKVANLVEAKRQGIPLNELDAMLFT